MPVVHSMPPTCSRRRAKSKSPPFRLNAERFALEEGVRRSHGVFNETELSFGWRSTASCSPGCAVLTCHLWLWGTGRMSLSWKNMNWLAVAGAFTVAYGVAIELTLGWERTRSFLIDDTKLNEVGDFLAGVFAPIALIWLVAAVLTQRQELNETRSQFEENQKVVDAQLKTINSQNALLSLQHTQSVEDSKRSYKLSLFDKRFAIYQKFIMFDEDHGIEKDYDESSYFRMINLSQEAAFVFDKTIEDWLDDIARDIYDYIEFVDENPLKSAMPNLTTVPTENELFNRALLAKRAEYKKEISDQFMPDTRTSKFWRYMYVSDEPLITG